MQRWSMLTMLLSLLCLQVWAVQDPTARNGARCGTGTVTLNVGGWQAGYNVLWADNPTGNNPTNTGTDTTFTTPAISQSTTYYVAFDSSGTVSNWVAIQAQINKVKTDRASVNIYVGQVGRYDFNQNVVDQSGNAIPNNGIATALTYVTDRFGNPNSAASFNGTTSQVATSRSFNSPTNFTISIWFNTTSNLGGRLIGFGNNQFNNSGNYDRHIFMTDAGQLAFGFWNGAEQVVRSPLARPLNDGQWHHVVGTLSTSGGQHTILLYVDGQQVAGPLTAGNIQSYSGWWKIGNDQSWTGATREAFQGLLDDAAIYDRVLNAAEVAELNSPALVIQTTNVQICQGDAPAVFTIFNTEPSVKYQLLDATTLAPLSAEVAGNGLSTVLQTATLTAAAQIKISLRDTVTGCSAVLDSTWQVFYGTAPAAPTAPDVRVCGRGTATITASGSPSTYRWYANAITNQVLATGATYTTGILNPTDTVTYYVSAVEASGCESLTRTRVRAFSVYSVTGLNIAVNANLRTHLFLRGSATDASGVTPLNNAVVTGLTRTANRYGVPNAAFALDGNRQKIRTTVAFNNPTVYTASVWFRTTTSRGGLVMGLGNSNTGISSVYNRQLFVGNDGKLNFGYTATFAQVITSTAVVNDGRWHHAAIAASATGLKLYVDGQLDGQATVASSAITLLNPAYWHLGGDSLLGNLNAPTSSFLQGELDEFRLYTRELDTKEIEELANQAGVSTSAQLVCDAASANGTITLYNSTTGISYQVIDGANNNIGTAISGNGDTLNFTVPTPAGSTSYKIKAIDAGSGCEVIFDSTITFKVGTTPAIALVANTTLCTTGPITLNVTNATGGTVVKWFTTPTGGLEVASGSSLTTPSIAVGDSLIYYAETSSPEGCIAARTKVKAYVALEPIDLAKPASVINNRGLRIYYPFNNSFDDQSGVATPNNGVAVNGPTFTTDRFGRLNEAISVDRTLTQYVRTSNTINNPQTFTVGIWFKTNTTGGGRIFGFGNAATGNSTDYDRSLIMNNQGRLNFGIYDGGIRQVSSTLAYNDNQWHLAVCSFSPGGAVRMYVDGLLIGSLNYGGSAQNYTGYWRIGQDNVTGWGNTASGFTGDLDDFFYHNVVLTDAEVAELWRPRGVEVMPLVCGTQGQGMVRVRGSEAGVSYQLRKVGGNLVDTARLSVAGEDLTVKTDTISADAQYQLVAVRQDGGCTTVSDSIFDLKVRPAAPQVRSNDVFSCNPGPLQFRATGTTQGFYRWYTTAVGGSPLANNTDTLVTPTVAANDSAVYYVSAITTDGCESARYRVVGKAYAPPAQMRSAAQTTAGLVTYLPLNGDLLDVSGVIPANNGTGTSVQDTTDRFSNRRSALYFNGTGARVTTSRQVNNPRQFTIMTWFKTSQPRGRLIGFGNSQTGNSSNYDRILYINGTGRLVAGIFNGAVTTINTPNAVNDNQWHFAAFSVSGSQAVLYLDGIAVGQFPVGSGPQGINGWWRLGDDNISGWTGANSAAYTGAMDDVRIFDRALSAQEIIAYTSNASLNYSLSQTLFCGTNGSATLTLRNPETRVKYVLRNQATEIGLPVAGAGRDSIVFSTGNVSNTTTYNIYAVDTLSGCAVQMDSTFTVTIGNVPALPLANDTVRCGAGALTLRASVQPGEQVRWYQTATSTTPIGALPTLSVTLSPNAGTPVDSAVRYVVAVSPEGCEGPRKMVTGRAGLVPTATITPSTLNQTVCSGDSILLTAPAGFARYNWTTGDTTQTIWVKNTSTGIRVTVTSALGCNSAQSSPVNITQNAKPETPWLQTASNGNNCVMTVRFNPPTPTPIIRWFRDGVLQTAFTTANVTNPADGNWRAVIVRSGCSSDSSEVAVVTQANRCPTSLNSALGASDLQLYPNPTTGIITLEWSADLEGLFVAGTQLQVLDAMGRLVRTTSIDFTSNQADTRSGTINLQDLPAGLYFVELVGGSQRIVKRVMKQ